MTPRQCLPWLLALILPALPLHAAVAQDDAGRPVIPFDGPDVFCYLLHSARLNAVKQIADLAGLPPADTVVIIFGETHAIGPISRAVGRLDKFLGDGGNLLVASDFPDEGRLGPLGVVISGKSVEQENEALAFRGTRACPLLVDFGLANPLLFQGLQSLATNRPSDLFVLPKSRLQAMANFPPGCSTNKPYMAATPWPTRQGRALVLAGHGLFTNGMMLQPGVGNFGFAVNCIRWLGEAANDGKRRHALFVLDGAVVDRFDVSLKPPMPPIPPIPVPTIEVVNQLLSGIEREGILLQILRSNFDVRSAARFSLLVLTIVLLLVGAKRLADGRYHPEAGGALLVGPYAPPATTAPLVRQRFRSQVEHHALRAEARALARQWFAETCGIDPAGWDQVPAAPPAIDTTGGWWDCRRLRRQTDRLWHIAGQGIAAPFSWRELVRLTSAIQELNEAIREGRLTFPLVG